MENLNTKLENAKSNNLQLQVEKEAEIRFSELLEKKIKEEKEKRENETNLKIAKGGRGGGGGCTLL